MIPVQAATRLPKRSQIATGKAPESLHGKSIFSLDLTAMLEALPNGEFENRLRANKTCLSAMSQRIALRDNR